MCGWVIEIAERLVTWFTSGVGVLGLRGPKKSPHSATFPRFDGIYAGSDGISEEKDDGKYEPKRRRAGWFLSFVFSAGIAGMIFPLKWPLFRLLGVTEDMNPQLTAYWAIRLFGSLSTQTTPVLLVKPSTNADCVCVCVR
jgi:hypothetical protein